MLGNQFLSFFLTTQTTILLTNQNLANNRSQRIGTLLIVNDLGSSRFPVHFAIPVYGSGLMIAPQIARASGGVALQIQMLWFVRGVPWACETN